MKPEETNPEETNPEETNAVKPNEDKAGDVLLVFCIRLSLSAVFVWVCSFIFGTDIVLGRVTFTVWAVKILDIVGISYSLECLQLIWGRINVH